MPRSARRPPLPAAKALGNRLATTIAMAMADERRRRALTMRDVADRARVSAATINALESGRPLSLDAYARVAVAFGMPLEWAFGRHRRAEHENIDLVHGAMGEYEARRLRARGLETSIDHPYQHYQFAGPADVLAWRMSPPSLLHIENQTRFPDLQQAAGSYNAKRQYLAGAVAKQLGLRCFEVETHVMVGLWSSEVMHVIPIRPASFEALCPDDADAWTAWLDGRTPDAARSSAQVLLDPFASGSQRAFIGLRQALAGTRPRMRGYAEAAERLRHAPGR